MNFNTQFYLSLSIIYFLAVSVFTILRIAKKQESQTIEEIESPKYTCSTQPSSSRFNYKRADLTIIIPEDELINASSQGELIVMFFKQNCFPSSVFKAKSWQMRVQKCSKWFLVQSFNLCSSILILKYSSLNESRADLFIVGPLICCAGGLMFAALVAIANGVKAEGRLKKAVTGARVVLFLALWAAGLYFNIWVTVTFTQGISKKDYFGFIVIVLFLEIMLIEFVRTSFKFSFYAWFKTEKSISEFIERA